MKNMKNKFYFFGLAVFLSFMFSPLSLFGQAKIGMPAGLGEAGLKSLIDKPDVLQASVADLPDDANKKSWFRLLCDAHIVTSVPIEKIYAVLNDFAVYKKVFGADVKILRTTGQGKIVRATAGKFGVNSTYVYLQTEPLNSETERLIVRIGQNTDGDDGTMKNMDTQYYMKTVTIEGKTYTYLRNYDITDYMSRIPFQKRAMSGGNESSHKDGLKDLIKAAK
jgi:hypothetical protein